MISAPAHTLTLSTYFSVCPGYYSIDSVESCDAFEIALHKATISLIISATHVCNICNILYVWEECSERSIFFLSLSGVNISSQKETVNIRAVEIKAVRFNMFIQQMFYTSY